MILVRGFRFIDGTAAVFLRGATEFLLPFAPGYVACSMDTSCFGCLCFQLIPLFWQTNGDYLSQMGIYNLS